MRATKIVCGNYELVIEKRNQNMIVGGKIVPLLSVDKMSEDELDCYEQYSNLGEHAAKLKASLFFFEYDDEIENSCLVEIADAVILRCFDSNLPLAECYEINTDENTIKNKGKTAKLPTTGSELAKFDSQKLINSLHS